MITLTTDTKLVARNGRVIHATAPNCQGVALCSPNMAYNQGVYLVDVQFMALTDPKAPVTCKNCCRKLGIEAPKSLPTLKAVKAWLAKKPEPTATEAQAAIEAQREAALQNTAAGLAFDAGVKTYNGESFAAWLPGGENWTETLDVIHGWAAKDYAWALKLAKRAARKAK